MYLLLFFCFIRQRNCVVISFLSIIGESRQHFDILIYISMRYHYNMILLKTDILMKVHIIIKILNL